MTADDLHPDAPLPADGWDSIIDHDLHAVLSALQQPGTLPELAAQNSTLQAMAAVMTEPTPISAATRARGRTMIDKLKTKAALIAVASAVVFGGAAAAATGGVLPFVNEPSSDPTTITTAVDSDTTTSTDATEETSTSLPEESTTVPEESTTVPESTSTTVCTAGNHGEHVSDVAHDHSSDNHGKSVSDAAHDDCGKHEDNEDATDDSTNDDADENDHGASHDAEHGAEHGAGHDSGNHGGRGGKDGGTTETTRPESGGHGNDGSHGNNRGSHD